MRARYSRIAWGFLVVLLSAQEGFAQDYSRSYQPARPTTSPYLNLLRSNFGPLPNYHSLVRPELQQQEVNREMSRALEYNFGQLSTLQRQQQQQLQPQEGAGVRVRSARMRPTGVAAQFQYYSHYFPEPQERVRRRR